MAGSHVEETMAGRAAGQKAIQLLHHLGRPIAEPLKALPRSGIDREAQAGPEDDLVFGRLRVQALERALEPQAPRIERLRSVPQVAESPERPLGQNCGGEPAEDRLEISH